MDILRLKLARHTFNEAGQTHLPHGERCRVCKSLDARRRAREQNRSFPCGDHPFRCGLSNEKSAISGNQHGLENLFLIQLRPPTMYPTPAVLRTQASVTA